MKSIANVQWTNGLKDGEGIISTESGVLKNTSYSFGKRFGDEQGTNPEELIAAAHASCFSMALSNEIAKVGLTPKEINTKTTVTLEMLDSGPKVTKIHLNVTASTAENDEENFQKAAQTAKTNCPISKLLNADITMDAKLKN